MFTASRVSIDALLRIAHVRWGGACVPMAFSFLDLLSFEAGDASDLTLATASGEFLSTAVSPDVSAACPVAVPGGATLYVACSGGALAKTQDVVAHLDPKIGALVAEGAAAIGSPRPLPIDVRFETERPPDPIVEDVWQSVSRRLDRSLALVGIPWRCIFRYPVETTWCGFARPTAAKIPDEDVRVLTSLLNSVFTTGLVQIAKKSDRTYVAIPFSFWGVAAWLAVLFEIIPPTASSPERAQFDVEQLETIRLWYSTSPFSEIREYLPHLFANSVFRELAAGIASGATAADAELRFRAIVAAFPELRRAEVGSDPFGGLTEATGFKVGDVLTHASIWAETGRVLPGSSEEAWNAENRTTFERELLGPAALLSEAISDKTRLAAELRGAADMSYELAHEIGQVIRPLLPGQYSKIVRSWTAMRKIAGVRKLDRLLEVDGYVIPFGSIYTGAVQYLDLMSQSSRGSAVVRDWTGATGKKFFNDVLEFIVAPAAFAVHERGTSANPDAITDVEAVRSRARQYHDTLVRATFLDASLEEMKWPTDDTDAKAALAQLFVIALLNAAKHSSSRQADRSWTVTPIVIRFDGALRSIKITSVSFSDKDLVSPEHGTLKVLHSLSQRINATTEEDLRTNVGMCGLLNDLDGPSRAHLTAERVFVTTVQFGPRTREV